MPNNKVGYKADVSSKRCLGVDVMRKDVERDSGPIMKKFAANQILLV
jgi:hypothetical protein